MESKLWGVFRKRAFYPRSRPAGVGKAVSNDLTFPWYLLEETVGFLEGSVFGADSSCLFSKHHYLWQVMKYSVNSDMVKVGIIQKGLALIGCDYCIPYESLQAPTSCVHTRAQTQRTIHPHVHVCMHVYAQTQTCLPVHADTANVFAPLKKSQFWWLVIRIIL